ERRGLKLASCLSRNDADKEHARPPPSPTVVELRHFPHASSRSSPSPPLEERAGERRPFSRERLNSTAVHPSPLPRPRGEGERLLRVGADHCVVSSQAPRWSLPLPGAPGEKG